jgi:tetratricopeptide (TPR) repeat protein
MSHNENFQTTCKRCQFEMGEASYVGDTLICEHCGHSHSEDEEKLYKNSQKQFFIILGGLGVFLIFAFMHVINWDRHSLSIVPLQIKYSLGMSSQVDLRSLAQICTDRMKYSCTESALTELVEQGGKAEDYLHLGDLRRRIELFDESLLAYEDALQKTDKTSAETADIHFGMARSYEALGQHDKAANNYERAILAKPEVTQITVLEAYVQLLIKTGHMDKAELVVKEARKRSGSERLLAAAIGG